MEPRGFRKAVEADIRAHELIAPGGAVTCLVSGGADSTCLWHVLTALGYRVSALHVNHGLRGTEADADADFGSAPLGAEGTIPRLGERRSAAPELVRLPDAAAGSERLDVGGGRTAVGEYGQVWLERTPVALDREVRWGPWRIAAEEKGLKVRAWRPG